jgi:hypothetical protein
MPSNILSLWAICCGFAAAYGPQKENFGGGFAAPEPPPRKS